MYQQCIGVDRQKRKSLTERPHTLFLFGNFCGCCDAQSKTDGNGVTRPFLVWSTSKLAWSTADCSIKGSTLLHPGRSSLSEYGSGTWWLSMSCEMTTEARATIGRVEHDDEEHARSRSLLRSDSILEQLRRLSRATGVESSITDSPYVLRSKLQTASPRLGKCLQASMRDARVPWLEPARPVSSQGRSALPTPRHQMTRADAAPRPRPPPPPTAASALLAQVIAASTASAPSLDFTDGASSLVSVIEQETPPPLSPAAAYTTTPALPPLHVACGGDSSDALASSSAPSTSRQQLSSCTAVAPGRPRTPPVERPLSARAAKAAAPSTPSHTPSHTAAHTAAAHGKQQPIHMVHAADFLAAAPATAPRPLLPPSPRAPSRAPNAVEAGDDDDANHFRTDLVLSRVVAAAEMLQLEYRHRGPHTVPAALFTA